MTNHRANQRPRLRPSFQPISFTLTHAEIAAIDVAAVAAGHHNRSQVVRGLVRLLEGRCPFCGSTMPDQTAELAAPSEAAAG